MREAAQARRGRKANEAAFYWTMNALGAGILVLVGAVFLQIMGMLL